MAEMQDKQELSSTGAGISRENSLSSLPETECEWPHLEATVREPPAMLDPGAAAVASWQPQPASPSASAQPALANPTTPEHLALPAYQPAVAQAAQDQLAFFQVSYLGGIEVRAAPDFDAPRTGLVLMQSEVIPVSHHLAGTDGRIYLYLADGQGWIFDDSALVPHDPSVVPLPYSGPAVAMSPPWEFPPAAAPVVETVHMPAPPPPPLHPPQCEILSSVPAGPPPPVPPPTLASPVAWYRVAYLGGINVRTGPSFDAPLVGVLLPQNETFPVDEEMVGSDGRVYLHLCDGRGWAFDDSALMPLDPSVKRGNWMPSQSATQVMGTRVLQEVQADALPVRRRMHPQPRGKRGGKRCSKRPQNSSTTSAGSAGVAVERR
jgi:hypothetical protein